MLTKKTLLVGALVATLGAGAVGIGVTHAAEKLGGTQPKFMTEVVSAIADKFNLDVDDVQAVVDEQIATHKDDVKEHRDDMREQHEQKFEEMLAQAVTDGDLTQSQADEILTKRAELKSLAESLKDSTPEERKSAMDEEVQSINDWAKDNDIPEQYVHFGPPPRQGGMMGGRGMGMQGGMMDQR